MANANFIRMQPVSNSDLMCLKCVHLYDPEIKVCTCIEPQIVHFKKYIKDKYVGK